MLVPGSIRSRSRRALPDRCATRKQSRKDARVLRWALGLYIVFLVVFVGSVLWLSRDLREHHHESGGSSFYPSAAPAGVPSYSRAHT